MIDLFDLRSAPDAVLVREFNRRQAARRNGYCDFCERPFDSIPLCDQPERHYPIGVPNCKGAHR